jgi:aminopeptidase N
MLPIAIDIYESNNKKRYNVWTKHRSDTFSFAVNSKPDLINVDGDKILICEKTDHKTLDEFIYQYKVAALYIDRVEAIEYTSKNQTGTKELGFLKTALNDKSYRLRQLTLDKLDINNDTVKRSVEALVTDLAKNDRHPLVKARAIQFLSEYKKAEYKSLYLKALNDSSYSVAGNALEALGKIDSITAINEARYLPNLPKEL